MTTELIPINKIKMPNRQIHLDIVAELYKDIGQNGQVKPVHLNKNMNLLDGLQRITAMKRLGYNKVQVEILDFGNPKT